jgi:hypothetical protein
MTAIAVLALLFAAVTAGEEIAFVLTAAWAISTSLVGALMVLWWLRSSAGEARRDEPEKIRDILVHILMFILQFVGLSFLIVSVIFLLLVLERSFKLTV